MADMRRFLDIAGLEVLVAQIKAGDAAALKAAKDYCDSLEGNYEAAGSVAAAVETLQAAIAEVDGKITAIKDGTSIDSFKDVEEALAGKQATGDYATKAEAQGYANAKDEAIAAALKAGEDAQDALDEYKESNDQAIADLEAYVGTFTASEGVDTVVKYIDAKTANIASDETVGAIDERLTQAEKDIDAIEADYLKAADKTELEGKITAAQNAADGAQSAVDTLAGTHATDKQALTDAIALKADITALNAVSDVANAAVKQSDYDVKVKALEDEDARIVGLVEAEATKAREEEGKLEERLEKVETFFELAEGEKLDEAKDTLIEIQKLIDEDAAAADQMVKDIAANKKAIEDHAATDHDFASADASLKSELEGKINAKADSSVVEGIDGRLKTAEGTVESLGGRMDDAEEAIEGLQGAVATKVEQEAYNTKIAALEGEDTAIKGRLDVVEAQLGDGENSVSDLIATAKQEAIDAAAGDATSKANAAESAAKGHADSLNSAMNTRVEALEAIDHSHANQAELDLIASGDKAKWDAAAGKAHEHANADVINGITAEKVAAWDAAEANAKAHADAEVAKDRTRLDAVEKKASDNEAAIALKADASALEAAITRIGTNETNIAANTAAIAKFIEITPAEINALFAEVTE